MATILDYPFLEKVLMEGESGDAEALFKLKENSIAYDHSRREWYLFTGNHWELDTKQAVFRFVACELAAEFHEGAAEASRQGKITRAGQPVENLFSKRAFELKNRRRIENVLFLAARHPGIALSGDEWDKNPWLLAVENGVIDLKTGTLRQGKPDDFIRSHAPVIWEGIDMPCPLWEEFQNQITGFDRETQLFKQRVMGYAITGTSIEHKLFIPIGDGRNGKSTEYETYGSVFGVELSTTSDADTIMDTNKNGSGPQPFVYALRGKRFVWLKESNEGRKLNHGLVKELTGGDTLTVRDMYSRPVTFTPSHTLFLMTNNKPHISADDTAIWDRVILIPYDQRFIENPQKPNEHKVDKNLREKLEVEKSGILAWLVRGCLDWQRQGLNVPKKLIDVTNEYRSDEDSLQDFINDSTLTDNPKYYCPAADLYKDYKIWAIDNGINPMSNTAFGTRIKKKFAFEKKQKVVYLGITLSSRPLQRP